MTAATDGKNRTRPSTAIYRAIMLAVETRRQEVAISMMEVDEIAGTQSGYYGKAAYPDTPNGRQARWETMDLIVEALFGRGYEIIIVPGSDENRRLHSALRIDQSASANALKIRHWRHTKHFQDLGRRGAIAGHLKRSESMRSKMARKIAKIRWKKAKEAERQETERA